MWSIKNESMLSQKKTMLLMVVQPVTTVDTKTTINSDRHREPETTYIWEWLAKLLL